MASYITDDKSPLCIPFITGLLEKRSPQHRFRPFMASARQPSIDDLYLKHEDQVALARSHPDNLLVQQRSEPGTHDMQFAQTFFDSITSGESNKVPSYDKAAFSGQDGRLPESQWVNGLGKSKVQVVIFEGWCVGFRALPEARVEARWKAPNRALQRHKLKHLLLVNERLKDYDTMTDLLDVFIHIDAEDTQHAELRQERGTGMTDEQVVKFADSYCPAYELFSDNARRGVLPKSPGHQMRLAVVKDRRVKEHFAI
ncbi:D-glycerate 3-kinase [Colletotrichum cereale]|nr:D-glycerate 3-kinase [Colletotrichum cereale]